MKRVYVDTPEGQIYCRIEGQRGTGVIATQGKFVLRGVCRCTTNAR